MASADLELDVSLSSVTESQFLIVWRRFRRHRLALLGGIVILSLSLLSLVAPWLTGYDPTAQVAASQNLGIFSTDQTGGFHLLGTDAVGRDLFTRLWFAGRISLVVGLVTALLSTTIGMILGAVAGYYGGLVDGGIMRLVDLMLTLPGLPVLLALSSVLRGVQLFGITGEWNSVLVIIAVLTLLNWTEPARLIRGVILSLRNQQFTEASRALGVSNTSIIVRHMIPNALAPLIVSASLAAGNAILAESALSFLGFGVQPPIPTWGNMLNDTLGRMLANYALIAEMSLKPDTTLYPGLLIFFTVLSFNFLGDGLRDALDPRLQV